MKRIKKMMALIIAMAMVLGLMSMTAFAEDPTYSITVTPSGSGVSIDGKTFNAYKLFDVTYADTNEDNENDAFSYSIDTSNYFYTTAAAKAVLDQYFTFQDTADPAVKTVLIKDNVTFDTKAAYEMAEKMSDANVFSSAPVANKTGTGVASNDSATIEVNEPGYYFVTGEGTSSDNQTVVAATALTTTQPTATIKAKVDAPSIDKTVDTPIDTDKHENQKAIGDTVNFQIDTKVPDMTGYTKKYFFIVTDHLSGGLTYQPSSLKVQLNNADMDTDDYDVLYSADGSTYSASVPANYKAGDELYIKVVFKNFIQYKGTYNAETETWTGSKEGQPITIKYDAILNDEASLTTANKNEVDLTYSNNPNDEGEGQPENPDEPGSGDATGKTPKHETNTYMTGIELEKVDGKDANTKLKDVEFVVKGTAINDIKETTYERYVKVAEGQTGTYYLLNDGSYTDQEPITSGDGKNDDKYAETTPNYKKETGTAYSKTSGEEVSYIVKTDNNGKITLSGLKEGTYTITEIKTVDGYNLLKDPITIVVEAETETTGTGAEAKTTFKNWKFTKDTDDASTDVNADGRFEFQVQNNKGTELPSTGGIGTTIFYVVGTILVIGAGVVMITRRRMEQ